MHSFIGHKQRKQTEKGLNGRKAALSRLVARYNSYVQVMEKNLNNAPKGAKPPAKLQMKGLFSAGVDDPVWRDASVWDGESAEMPAWLCDENVQAGIIAMLDLKCSRVELARLRRERSSLQMFYVEQHNAMSQAIQDAGMCLILVLECLLNYMKIFMI